MPLPERPKVALDIVADHSPGGGGFLTLRRFDLAIGESAPFRYDMVERKALDAAIIAAHYVDSNGRAHVYLRSSIRPPLHLRGSKHIAEGALWELPAGLIEPGEAPRDGAARELEEELGFSVSPERLLPLGPPTVPCPSFIAEIQFLFHVSVDPTTRKEPNGDGSPIEQGALITSVPLDEALLACQRGELPDTKTELGLRRLAEILSHGET